MTLAALPVKAATPLETPIDDLLRCDDDALWDEFVGRSPHGSPFVQSWFLDALDVEVDRWLLLAGARAIAGGVVLRSGSEVLPAPLPFSPYQGLLLAPETTDGLAHRIGKEIVDVTQALVEALARRYEALSFCLHPTFTDVRGLQWFRYGQADTFRFEVRYTGVIDLAGRSFDEVLAALRSTRRYEYRRAARALKAEVSTDVATLDALHEATFARQGLTRSPEEARLMRALAEKALASGAGELLVARAPNGEPASATLFVSDEHRSYYLFGANSPKHRSLGGNSFLVVEAVRRALERGLTEVDLLGVNSPHRGDFKTSLGARVVPYYQAHFRGGRTS